MNKALLLTATVIASMLLAGCGEPEKTSDETASIEKTTSKIADSDGKKSILQLNAVGLRFEGPKEIASGWTTIRFRNLSAMVHFALVERLPEGVTPQRVANEASAAFQRGMDLLNAGDTEAAMEVFNALPEWFGELVFMGGTGLLSGGETAETTVFLEPGRYLIECYVKTNGVFHSYNPKPDQLGMVHELTVTEAASGAAEPDANVTLTVSSEGFEIVDGKLHNGTNTIRVDFRDQIVYPNFTGHDVHIVRVGTGTDLNEVSEWMDWREPEGFETPAPATFLGGVNDMPAGNRGYMTIDLEPGNYAFIAEVPAPGEKGLLLPFAIEAIAGEPRTEE